MGLMEKMMEKFFADMTPEDKQKMVETMMPKMMEMMPQSLRMMLPSISKEKRIDFVLKMVTILVGQDYVRMSDEELYGVKDRIRDATLR